MTAAAFLAELRARGVVLEAHGDQLRFHPADRMTGADLEALRAHKPDLLVHLRDLASLEADGTAARLRALHAALTPDERARLAAEAAAGDTLAALVVATLAADQPGAPDHDDDHREGDHDDGGGRRGAQGDLAGLAGPGDGHVRSRAATARRRHTP